MRNMLSCNTVHIEEEYHHVWDTGGLLVLLSSLNGPFLTVNQSIFTEVEEAYL